MKGRLKIGELDVKVHLDAMKPAYDRELVECRVTRREPGTAERRA